MEASLLSRPAIRLSTAQWTADRQYGLDGAGPAELRDAKMDAPNPYQPPRPASSRSAASHQDGGQLSPDAISAIGATRLALWFFIGASGLMVLFTLLQFGLAWRYMASVDDSGNYGVVVFFSMLKGPAAGVCCWLFYSFERSLRRLAAGGRLKPMLVAQKKLWVTLAGVGAAYLAALIIGAMYLSVTK